MISVSSFNFNPFEENTYVLYDTTDDCIVIDPGCSNSNENQELISFIDSTNLTPKKLINTHCHIDHVLGNRIVADTYDLKLEMHQDDLPILNATKDYGAQMGIEVQESPQPSVFLTDGDIVHFGDSELLVLFTPGHSPGSISFYSEADKFVIGGDVLFLQSIGRTDLPGGNMDVLMDSIINQLFSLPDDVVVYSGHGPTTTIGFEKANNPFILNYQN